MATAEEEKMSVKRLLLATSVALLALAALVGVASSQTFPDGNVVYLTGTADPVGTCIVGTEYYRTDTATRFSCTDGTWGAYADTGGTAPLVISDTQLTYSFVSPSDVNFTMDFDDEKDNNIFLLWTGIAEADKSIEFNQDVDTPKLVITVAETDVPATGSIDIREDRVYVSAAHPTGSSGLRVLGSYINLRVNSTDFERISDSNTALVDNTTTTLVQFPMGFTQGGGILHFSAFPLSGARQSVTAEYSFTCVGDGSDTEVCDIDVAAESTAVSSGTLTCTPSFDTTPVNAVNLQVLCDTSLDVNLQFFWTVSSIYLPGFTYQ